MSSREPVPSDQNIAATYRKKWTARDWVGLVIFVGVFLAFELVANGVLPIPNRYTGVWTRQSPSVVVNAFILVFMGLISLEHFFSFRERIEVTATGDLIGTNWLGKRTIILRSDLPSYRLAADPGAKRDSRSSTGWRNDTPTLVTRYRLEGPSGRIGISTSFVEFQNLFAYLRDEGLELPSAIEDYLYRVGQRSP